jgi:hypothetical protein
MLIAPTLESVVSKVEDSFIEIRMKRDGPGEALWQLMRPGDLYDEVKLVDKVKLVGLLFMHPDSKLPKADILPRLGQYHERAGKLTDFFFAGYGAYWPPDEYSDQREVAEIDGTKWYYSDRAFSVFRQQLESETRWKYSGETDLILTTARFSKSKDKGIVDFSQCITCCLEQLIRDKATTSIPAFFEQIFRFGDKDNATVYDFSDLHLVRTAGTSLLEWVLARVKLKEFYNRNKNLAIRNIAK